MSEVRVETFGCRLNTFESEIMRGHAEKAGLSDAIIFNTCAVTAEATRQARQAIRKARKENPDAQIIVTGCAAQTESETFAAMPEVTRILGNEEKLVASSWLKGSNRPRVDVSDIMQVKETRPPMIVLHYPIRARQFPLSADCRCCGAGAATCGVWP
jgi:threonylcarbamoyladenosine tRNA methylthiotransferase MtaB